MSLEPFFIFAECCLAFFVALLASLAITPVVRSLAEEWNFVDRPDGGRKAHGRPIALGGGVAVLVSVLVAAGVTFAAASARGANLLENSVFFGLLASALLICVVGLIDDFVGLKGHHKLAGQVAAALILVASGLSIEKVSLHDMPMELGVLAIPFTLFWLLGAINAINLLDGIDGLASSLGVVLSLTLAGLAFFHANFHAEAIIALVLAGALLGFLRFNFAPATIFLGDSGSMLIGLIIGAVAVRCTFKEAATVALAVPVALWAIPLLDSAAAIVRRKLTGRSLFATDRGHLHHVLLVRGWTVRQAVFFITLICAVTCSSAILSYHFENDFIAWFTVLGVVGFLIVMGIFGHIEFALVREHVRSTTRSLSQREGESGKRVHKSVIRLQGSQEWDHLWSALTESAENHHLIHIELTLNLPALHEALYANWKCAGVVEEDRAWRVVCPLIVDDQPIGNLTVMGMSPQGATLNDIGRIAEFLDPVEDSIRKVVAEMSKQIPDEDLAEQPTEREVTESTVGPESSNPIPHGG